MEKNTPTPITYPFVNFLMEPTQGIGSTPTLIFGNENYACIIEGIIVASQVNNQLLFSLYFLREDDTVSPPVATEYMLTTNQTLTANESIDWMHRKTIILQPGDALFAYSDYSDNLFNTFVSYRELKELSA